MSGSEPLPGTHICDFCFKSYQRRDLLLRHRRRCLRSDKPTTRRKACNACVQAKAKCCYTQPTCSRCAKRNIVCKYASMPQRAARVTPPFSSNATSASIPASSSSFEDPSPLDKHDVRTTNLALLWSRQSSLGDPDADPTVSWTSQNFPWDMDTINLASVVSPPADLVHDMTPDPAPAITTRPQSVYFPELSSTSQQSYPMLDEEIPALAVSNTLNQSKMARIDSSGANNSPRAFLSTGDVSGVRQADCARLLQQYPKFLLQDDFYCPFLHRTLFSDNVPDTTMLPHTSMAICCGSALGNKEGVGYTRRAIDAQRQSLIESYSSYHCLQQWDALHAMLLYEILEMGTASIKDTERWKLKRRTRGLKSPFLLKMTQCFSRSHLDPKGLGILPDTQTQDDWSQWAVAETARRTMFLANIINFFSNRDLESGHQSPYYEPLNDELVLKMPLPCQHAVWSARTRNEWCKATQMARPDDLTGPSGPLTDAEAAYGAPDSHDTSLATDPDIAVDEQLPNYHDSPSLSSLFATFTKDHLRAKVSANAGFADSNELCSFVILCALEQFP
ncbi:hypothetical protein PDE_04782 [Penicillium oxalicum 114-2]|uniref:Zn(2)-C6 fungal-type domain-containing protein n=1 Tax=Penicillium oxalicum (strain 114-2 / CGMCC 5302) TaxID=933388 RepID=S8B5J9_PENO1|nr:hypothetical protein PDE_04782 [Penicillium oxalicum 114-2]